MSEYIVELVDHDHNSTLAVISNLHYLRIGAVVDDVLKPVEYITSLSDGLDGETWVWAELDFSTLETINLHKRMDINIYCSGRCIMSGSGEVDRIEGHYLPDMYEGNIPYSPEMKCYKLQLKNPASFDKSVLYGQGIQYEVFDYDPEKITVKNYHQSDELNKNVHLPLAFKIMRDLCSKKSSDR
jgi:hypothetical protein